MRVHRHRALPRLRSGLAHAANIGHLFVEVFATVSVVHGEPLGEPSARSGRTWPAATSRSLHSLLAKVDIARLHEPAAVGATPPTSRRSASVAEQEALPQRDAQSQQSAPFLLGFDALGDQLRTRLAGEVRES